MITTIALAILALTAQNAFGQTLSMDMKRIKDDARETDYTISNIVPDSVPKVISPTFIEIYFHLEVVNGAEFVFTSLAAKYVNTGTGGTPIFCSKQDSAGQGYSGEAVSLGGLVPGDTIISTVFGSDNHPFTNEIIPYQIFWITALDPMTGVPVTSAPQANYLTVGPNPASATAIVHTPLWRGTQFSVHDMAGHDISSFPASGEGTSFETVRLPKGMYIIVAENSNLPLSHQGTKFLKL